MLLEMGMLSQALQVIQGIVKKQHRDMGTGSSCFSRSLFTSWALTVEPRASLTGQREIGPGRGSIWAEWGRDVEEW